jgi:uridine kinase
VILRGGSVLETGLRRTIPDCRTGRILIQTNYRTGEPELHYRALASGTLSFTVNLHVVMLISSLDMSEHAMLLLLDSQMSTGGAALMAVRVLVDHGVPEDRIVFVTYMAGRVGVNRLLSVFPEMRVVMCRMGDDMESRWVEARYLGC